MTIVRSGLRRIRPALHALAGAGLGLLAAATWAQAPTETRYPVSAEQKRTADEVARNGVPLSALAPTAPESHTVQTGDTLWGLSSLFLTSPWRWPELWGMNKEQINNPHLIYPGQVLRLVKIDGRARLQLEGQPSSAEAMPGQPGDLVKLSPQVRESTNFGRTAISSIPTAQIAPYISRPLIVQPGELDSAARIVGVQEGRVYLARGDIVYARGIADPNAKLFHVYRPGQPLIDPDDPQRRRILGWEAFYLGTASLVKAGDIATLLIQESRQEIGVGDRLVPIDYQVAQPFVPRRPEQEIAGRVVSVYAGVNYAGRGSVVSLNRGSQDGVQVGHVLDLLQLGQTLPDRTVGGRETIKLPDERIGQMFVFRVFDHISYALILRVRNPVEVGDRFARPEPTD